MMVLRTITALLFCLIPWHGCGAQTGSFCQDTCPNGWFNFNNRCFQYIPTLKTWTDAETHCLGLGGNLASVHSDGEFQFISSLIRSKDPAENPAWIGLTDCQKWKTWLWSDGSEVKFYKWNTGEPNNGNQAEHCVHTSDSAQKQWNDISCTNSYAFVCALKQRKV